MTSGKKPFAVRKPLVNLVPKVKPATPTVKKCNCSK